MIRINLLAPENIQKEERNEFIVLGYAALILVILVGMGHYFIKLRSYKKIESRITATQTELTKYESIVRQVEALQSTKAVLETKKNVINTLMANGLLYPQYMEELLQLLPPGIGFKSMSTQLQADGSLNMSLDGEATDNYAIADLIAALSGCPDFSKVELGPINTNAARSSISGFRMTFSFKRKS